MQRCIEGGLSSTPRRELPEQSNVSTFPGPSDWSGNFRLNAQRCWYWRRHQNGTAVDIKARRSRLIKA